MLDIDYFKSINDRHGHDVGDAALCAVGSACQERTGEAAATTRWGGEWFVVVLPSTHNAAALASAEELCAAIAAVRLTAQKGEIRVTARFGIAVDRGGSAEDLLRRADLAPYFAKRDGYNHAHEF